MRELNLLLVIIFAFPLWGEAALDPYALMSSLLDESQHPRILNTLDLPNWNSQNPEPLFSPEGDFNNDGKPDMVIAGIYDLPLKKDRYFLIVGGDSSTSFVFTKFFFQEYPVPVFIHRPGTTGEGDPGVQAFSISFCWECDQGEDFYWNKQKHKFETKAWKAETKRVKKLVTLVSDEPPENIVDESLKIAGDVKEVQTYIANLKKRGGKLGTRVEWDKKSKDKSRTVVSIFEKKDGKEFSIQRLTVDLNLKEVLRIYK